MGREAGLPLQDRHALTGVTQSAGMTGIVRRLREAVLEPVASVLFPPRCVNCGDFEYHLCPSCETELTPIGSDCCPRCGEPGPRPRAGGRCSHCMGLEFAYAGARSAFTHTGPAKRMVVEFKAGGQSVLGSLMARLAAETFAELVADAQEATGGRPLVTWVPAHASDRRERGYNQAELLARALAGGCRPALAAADLAGKPVKTRHQKALGKAGRQANLHGAFILDEKVVRALGPRPTSLILVDDVYTTGATTQEVARVLAAGMGIPVYAFTFSRAVSGSGEGHD